MNALHLLEHYNKVVDAPGAISRLRRFILDLAIRGKLVPQEPSDERAEELLKRIVTITTQSPNALAKKTIKSGPDPADESARFALPTSWCWSNLAEIGFLSPRNDAQDDAAASFVPMSLIPAEYGVPSNHEVRRWGEIKKGYTHFAEGDVCLAKITPCFQNGKSSVFRNLTGGIGSGTTELHIVRPVLVDPEYILIFLKSPGFIQAGTPRMTGTAGQKRVPIEYFAHSPFPLPPLAEQHRIVDKVNELMTLCDSLDNAYLNRESARDLFAASCIARLNHTDRGPLDVNDDADLAVEAADVLTTRPDQIQDLRQAVLSLAVRGKLVPQNPMDETANQLLKQFAASKAEMKRKTGDPRIKMARCPGGDESPVPLPPGWSVQSFENLFLFIDYRGGTPPKTNDGVPLITAKNIRMGFLNREPHEYVSKQTYKAWMVRGFPRGGDLLFTTEAPLANVCVNNIDEPFALAQRAICLQPFAPINTRYLMFALMSEPMQAIIHANATGLTAKGIKAAKLKPLSIPIPPLAEQHRIVGRIDELMMLCERLEASLTATLGIRRALLDALIAGALAAVA